MPLLVTLLSCSHWGPLRIPCEPGDVELDLHQVGNVGVSPAELLEAANVGVLQVEWRSGGTDTLRVALEAAAHAFEERMEPADPESADLCRELESLTLPVEGQVWTSDGTVFAEVTGRVWATRQAPFAVDVSGPAEWTDPPRNLWLRFGEGPGATHHLSIGRDWTCDSQRHGDCLTW